MLLPKKNQVVFYGGRVAEILYLCSGSAVDWFYEKFGAHSFAIEMRPKDGEGFLISSDNIIPSGKEILEGVLSQCNFLLNKN